MLNESYEQISLTIAGWSVLAAIWFYAISIAFSTKKISSVSSKKVISFSDKYLPFLATGSLLVAFMALTVSLTVRGIGLGHVPIRNLYESMVILAWGMLGSYLFLEWRYNFRKFGVAVSIIVMGIFLNASWLPASQKDWSPLIPALQSYWRAIHVPPLLVSYALFLIGSIAASFYLFAYARNKKDKKLEFYEEATYRSIILGFPLLTFGIICGALWANHAWGAIWQWDPKETLALVTWFIYAAYIHLRLNGASAKNTSLIAIFGLLAVYITYMGINQFNLGGLHSYGNVE